MEDDGVDIVEGDAADLLTPGLDHQEAPMEREVAAIGRNINDPVHAHCPRTQI
jgi:hypothetical protein